MSASEGAIPRSWRHRASADPTARQDFRRTIEITRAYVLGFFDTSLRNRPSPLLTGKTDKYPEAWLLVYRPRKPKQGFPGAPTWGPQR
jgi:hypothetical protein